MKEKFSNFSPEVPAFMWDAVEERLETRRSKRIGVVWSSVATVVLIAVSGALFYNMPDTVKMKNQEITSLQEITSPIDDSYSKNSPSTGNNNAQNINIQQSANQNNTKQAKESTSIKRAERIISSNSIKGEVRLTNGAESSQAFNNEIHSVSDNKSSSVAKNKLKLAFHTDASVTSAESANFGYSEFLDVPYLGAQLKEIIVGEFLQLTLSIPQPQMPVKRKLSRWAFEVGYDMNQTAMSYSVNPQLGEYVHKNYLKRIKEGEVALVAPQLHTSLRYQLNRNWIVTAGFGFTQNRTSQSFDFRDSVPVSVSQGFEPDAYGNYPIFGYAGLGQRVKYDGVQVFNMFSIPIGIVYEHPITRKLKFTTEANLRYNYVSGTNGSTLNYYDLSLQESQKDLYRNSVFSAKFGAGVQKELDSKRSIGIRVNTQGSLTPLNLENSAVSNRGWSVGLSGYYFWRIF